VTAAARELNRRPALVEAARRTREWAMGDEKVLHRLPTARGRPSDLAVRQLAALTADSPGVLGELGLTVLQAWQRVSEAQGRGRGRDRACGIYAAAAQRNPPRSSAQDRRRLLRRGRQHRGATGRGGAAGRGARVRAHPGGARPPRDRRDEAQLQGKGRTGGS